MAQRDLGAHDASLNHAYAPTDNNTDVPVQHGRRRRGGWWWKLPLMAAMLLVGAAAAGVFWLDRAYADRVYPNVSVQGVPVGGSTRAEVEQAVRSQFASFLEQPATLSYGDRRWQPTLDDLGVTLDLNRSVDQAFAIGHGGTRVDTLRQMLSLAQPTDVPLHMVVDGAKLDAYLRKIAADIEVQPQEATINIVDGQVRTTPSVDGHLVLLSETANGIVDGLKQLEPQQIAIQTQDVAPRVSTAQVAEAERAVNTIIGAPLDLIAENQTFTLNTDALASMVKVERGERDGAVMFMPQLDNAKLEPFLRDITDKVGRAPVEPRVRWNEGALEITKPGEVGYGVDLPRAIEAINAAALTPERRVELPMGDVQPQARPETLGSLGVKELVAEGKSYFTGSPGYRITNIKAGVALIDGLLIPPGGTFSFTDTVGLRLDASKGFVIGTAIVNNKSVPERGGGICQVSTTMYRAAFYGGLPITERTAHAARLHYYEIKETIGMDAAIYTGTGPDLKYVNDTGNWLLIQGAVDTKEQSVSFRLYGTKVAGRTVERSEPDIDYYRSGRMKIVVTRTIKQDGNVVNTEDFVTNFQPLVEEEEDDN